MCPVYLGTYGSFDNEQDYLYLIICSLLCPVFLGTYGRLITSRLAFQLIVRALLCPILPHNFSRPVFWALDYITTYYLACQHFFRRFFKLFSRVCVPVKIATQYIVCNKKSPRESEAKTTVFCISVHIYFLLDGIPRSVLSFEIYFADIFTDYTNA